MNALSIQAPNAGLNRSYRGLRALGAATLAAFAAFGLMGCGMVASPTGSSSSSSFGASPTDTTTMISGGSAAECAGFSATGATLVGKIATFYPPGSSSASADTLRLLVTSVGTDFAQDSSEYIQFFRWQDLGTGANLDSNPVQFTVVLATSGQQLLGARNSLSGADLTSLRSQLGLSSSSTGTDILSKVMFIVTNLDFQWQALKVVLYNGGAAMGQVDTLIPMFLANPVTYGNSHAAELARIHPFYSQRSTSRTDADWVSLSRNYCF